jgi:UDP-GlcNAc3NAcA epimerase
MKIVTVLGGRPQFIKARVGGNDIALTSSLTEVLVHTGQHVDSNMLDVLNDRVLPFFKQHDIPILRVLRPGLF